MRRERDYSTNFVCNGKQVPIYFQTVTGEKTITRLFLESILSNHRRNIWTEAPNR